ncbi:helicase [Gallibacterium genomosp. 3]|uniref:Helicase n=1 Tax=Gallibacterium genomosp. 3 TaxID=505345 RepID=A0A1A7PM96_9PAST|nr:type I-F CRISPR-associated helicase Cas3f [Gallibacterium genomosp. 3]OBX03209.1 helicase [Gallibacterium genomosp. 3]
MNILLVSQCQKNALKETCRILDQFAERCGDRVWQTAITQAGLQTLKQLLRQTARKNTAVACYWTHGKNQTSLLWIVGDQSQFNQKGRIPTNRTQRDILRKDDEVAWINAYNIQIIAALAALLHDLGKSSIGFQTKLMPAARTFADCYRHEWVSVRIFEAMIAGCTTDVEWLTRLANWAEYQQQYPDWLKLLKKEGKQPNQDGFESLPPLAKALIWLISSHHRTPYLAEFAENNQSKKKTWHQEVPDTLTRFYRRLSASNGWVFNPHSEHPHPEKFWQFSHLVSDSTAWQKAMSRWANKALKHQGLLNLLSHHAEIADDFLLLLSRLSLITADHHYSSLPSDPHLGEKDFPLLANTDSQGKAKQRLDEHLLGVCQSAVRFARILPKLPALLPFLKHKGFNKRSDIARFQWQNRAFELAKQLQPLTEKQGFFGVNMASTGCGKTLGNTRIMYGLANPQQGARFTIALGLRVLTLQTGKALKSKLKLDDDELAVLVGGNAISKLFELQEKTGSESAEDWLDTLQIDGGVVGEHAIDSIAEFNTLLANQKAKQLLQTPLVTCTVDYLMNASECLRGGKHIVPILRLLTGDLILDEPDDFDQNDLPALSRLVHLAGLFGSKVLLSSATLTPDLISGLYEAYQTGRKIWNHNNNYPSTGVCCAWFDEFNQQAFTCGDLSTYQQKHTEFIQLRVAKLKQQPIRRIANVMDLPNVAGGENQLLNWPVFANYLINKAIDFHHQFYTQDSVSNKTVSLGLIRFANIKPIIPTILAMLQQQCAADTEIHICCYHSRQLLLLRNRLEQCLDRLLTRYDPQAIFQQPEIQTALRNSDKQHHIFIVVGSPVTEVGRDHDYDWAIIDPSSMRSIIQLAGRVWRHRPDKVAEIPNIALLPSNWRGLTGKPYREGLFTRPGFESKENGLVSHQTAQIITQDQLAVIDAIPRITYQAEEIAPKKNKYDTLAILEHNVMFKMFHSQAFNYVNGYWRTENAKLTAHYSLTTPFRASQPMEEFVCLPDELSEWHYAFAYYEKASQDPYSCAKEYHRFDYRPLELTNSQIKPWLNFSLAIVLDELAEELKNKELEQVAVSYATVSLTKDSQTEAIWQFNEFLGFWQKENEQ